MVIEHNFKEGDEVIFIKLPNEEDYRLSSCCHMELKFVEINKIYTVYRIGRKNSICLKENLTFYPAHCFKLKSNIIETW